MPFIEIETETESEGAGQTRLYYRDWGKGKPVVFVSSWAFSGAMWEYQMLALTTQGFRCLAYDRRGHGHSDDPGQGYDFDTLADDLAALLDQLDLEEVTLVGHSMGCAEIVRYLSRHGSRRVSRIVLVSPITPFLLQTEDNPQGIPKPYLDAHLARLAADRPNYFREGAISFFNMGLTWPGPPVLSNEMVEWAIRLIMESSPYAVLECRRATNETDFRSDLAAVEVPALVIHGDRDAGAPLELCGRPTAQAIRGGQLKIYQGAPHGLFLTERERLSTDLMTFIES